MYSQLCLRIDRAQSGMFVIAVVKGKKPRWQGLRSTHNERVPLTAPRGAALALNAPAGRGGESSLQCETSSSELVGFEVRMRQLG
jgi:hypothetical protein